MPDLLSAAAAARPDHLAVEAPDGSLTYAQLDAATNRCAGRLRALGVGRGDCVGVAIGPSLGFVELLHGAPRIGAAVVPLDPRARGELSERRAAAAGADLVLTEPPQCEPAAIEPVAEPDPDVALTVILTSGTTGEPRPVALSHANHAASAVADAVALGSDPGDRWLCPLPLFHVGGLNVLIRCLHTQTTAVLHARFDTERVAALLAGGEVTLASLVPTMLARLREAGLAGAPGLRAALLGGGPMTPELLAWAREHEIAVRCTYGMTETCSHAVITEPWELAGRPVAGTQIDTADDGEILVAGPIVASGALADDGWLHTGDAGHLDDAGRLHVTGRLKELIVSGGENVAPAAVEAVLLSDPAVRDAAVFGVADPEWGERVEALIVTAAPVDDEHLLALCRAHLAPHEVPKALHRVEGLPRNPAGKLLRAELAALARDRSPRGH